MSNPVLVEVTRGGRVESRHEGSVAVFDADGKSVLSIGDVDAAGLPALGGEGDPGPAAGRKRRGRALSASATANWRWPAPRIRASRRMWRLATDMLARPRWTAARSNAARTGRRTRRRPSRWRARAARRSALHNNCSGKHSGFLCACRHLRHQPSRLCRRRHRLSGDGARRASPRSPAPAWRAQPRHRRLLDPDLRGAAQKPGDGLCQNGHRHGFRPSAPRRRSDCSRPAWPSRSMSPAPAAPMSG